MLSTLGGPAWQRSLLKHNQANREGATGRFLTTLYDSPFPYRTGEAASRIPSRETWKPLVTLRSWAPGAAGFAAAIFAAEGGQLSLQSGCSPSTEFSRTSPVFASMPTSCFLSLRRMTNE